MSWFKYADQKVRRYRKGIWLRVRSLPDGLRGLIESNMQPGEQIAWVEVQELQRGLQVLLEIWCTQMADVTEQQQLRPQRYTVFHLSVPENPDWTCEGDFGRGLVVGKSRSG